MVQSVPASVIAKEKEILLAEAQSKGGNKRAEILEKMVQGRLNKYFEDTVLLEQLFVIAAADEKPRKVAQVLAEADKGARIAQFIRFSVGEPTKEEETTAT